MFKGTGGEAFAEQLIASGVKYVFGNSASEDAHFYEALVDPAAAPVHPHAARRSRRRDGRRLRQSLRPARHRHGGGGRRADQRARPDVQRVEGADAARLLLLPLGGFARRGARRIRGAARTGAAHDADDEADVDGARGRADSRDGPPRVPRGVDAAVRTDLHQLALRIHASEQISAEDHPARSGGPADARPAEPGRGAARGEAAGRRPASAAHRRRRDLQGEGVRQGRAARGAARAAGDAGAPACTRTSRSSIRCGLAAFRAGASSRLPIRPRWTSSSTSATSSSTTRRRRSSRARRRSSTCGTTRRASAT